MRQRFDVVLSCFKCLTLGCNNTAVILNYKIKTSKERKRRLDFFSGTTLAFRWWGEVNGDG